MLQWVLLFYKVRWALAFTTTLYVYKAVCISTLLFGSEALALYHSHVCKLEVFHIRSLQRILGLTWADHIPHVEILQQTGCFSIEALIIKRQLCWIGHVICMPENRFPRKLFYGELTSGYRSCGVQRKRYKDHLRSILKQCSISTPELESLAACCSTWRSTCNNAVVTFEARRTKARQLQRKNRHLRQAGIHPPPGTGVTCLVCNRRCASDFGLHSHMRVRNRT